MASVRNVVSGTHGGQDELHQLIVRNSIAQLAHIAKEQLAESEDVPPCQSQVPLFLVDKPGSAVALKEVIKQRRPS